MKEDKFSTIDEYIALQSEDVQDHLRKIRVTITKAVPEAKESISYQMPAFKYHGMLAYFAVFTNHYSIFVSPAVLNTFRPSLGEYSLSKSGIKIPKSKPVPVKLLTDIIRFAAARNLEKEELKKAAKKKNQKKP